MTTAPRARTAADDLAEAILVDALGERAAEHHDRRLGQESIELVEGTLPTRAT